MEKKKGSGGRLERFFAGKGFYIVLILCASSVVLINGSREETDVDVPADVAVIANDDEGIPDAQAPIQAEEPTDAVEAPEETTEAPASEQTEQQEETQSEAQTETETETQTQTTISTDLYVWPVAGEIEMPYSVDALVYNRTMADWRTHEGIDIAAEIGTQVMAAGNGKVESVYYDDLYGTTVIIEHYDGLRSIYCNLAETPTVYAGDSVSAGDVIGAVDDTALCETGEVAHLHFEMMVDGQNVDPTLYLPTR